MLNAHPPLPHEPRHAMTKPDAVLIFEQLTALTQQLTHSAEQRLSPHAISAAQIRLLEALATLGVCTQATLATTLQSTPANISQLLSKLEALGLITRDARGVSKHIKLTAQGRRELERLKPLRDTLIAERLSALTPQELQIMRMWLERLLHSP